MPPRKPKTITAAAFLAGVSKRKTVEATIPGLGLVKLQKLTVGEYDEIIDLSTVRDADGVAVLDANGRVQVDDDKRATMLLIAQIAEPQLTLEQVGSIDSFDVDTYLQIRAALATLATSQESAEARFPAGPAADGEVSAG